MAVLQGLYGLEGGLVLPKSWKEKDLTRKFQKWLGIYLYYNSFT